MKKYIKPITLVSEAKLADDLLLFISDTEGGDQLGKDFGIWEDEEDEDIYDWMKIKNR